MNWNNQTVDTLNRYRSNPSFIIFLVLISIVALTMVGVFFLHTLRLFESFRIAWSEDQAQFNQVMWNLVNNGNLSCSIYTTACFLGAKFDVILFFIAPFYFFYQHLTALWLVAVVCLCLTGVVLFLVSYQLTRQGLLSFLIALLFFTYGPAINLTTIGFRGTTIAMPFFALGLLFYLRRQFWPMMLALVMAAFCREDVPLILLGFSLLSLVERRSWRWTLVPGLFGLTYFYVIYSYLMPWFNSWPVSGPTIFQPNFGSSPSVGGANFLTYSHLGATPLQILINLFLRFDLVVQLLTRPDIIASLTGLLGPFYYLPVLSLFSYVPLSQYLVMYLSHRTCFAYLGAHYFAPVVPFLFAGLAGTLAGLLHLINKLKITELIKCLLIAGVIIMLLFMNWSARKNLDRVWSGLRPNLDYAKYEELFRKVPPEASVTAQIHYLQNFSSRANIYMLSEYPQTDYVVVQPGGYFWPLNDEKYSGVLQRMLISGDYGMIGRYKAAWLFKHGVSTECNAQVFVELFPTYTEEHFAQFVAQYKTKLAKLKQIEVSGENLLVNPGFESVLDGQPKTWQLHHWYSDPWRCSFGIVSVAKNGKNAVLVSHEAVADSRWGQTVKVKPNTNYELSGWIKTERVAYKGDGAYLELADTGAKSRPIRGTHSWQKVSAVGKTGPKQREVTVLCRLGGYGAPNVGTAYFDDIVLRETVSLDELY